MDSLPEQHIDSLPEGAREVAYQQAGIVCAFRMQGLSEGEVAKKAKFGSPEDMYLRLKRWGLSGLVPLGEPKAAREGAVREKGKRKAKRFGPKEPLPPAERAIVVFKRTLEMLIGELERLRGREEYLQSERFVAVSERGGEKLVSGARQEPPEPLTTFIAVEALVGGPDAWSPEMGRLLGLLHPAEPFETHENARGETIYYFREPGPEQLDMEGLDRALRDLRKAAGDVAKLVRGRKGLRAGRSTGEISAYEHAVLELVEQRAAEGVPDEQIAAEVNNFFYPQRLLQPLLSPPPDFTSEDVRRLRGLAF